MTARNERLETSKIDTQNMQKQESAKAVEQRTKEHSSELQTKKGYEETVFPTLKENHFFKKPNLKSSSTASKTVEETIDLTGEPSHALHEDEG